MIFIYYLRKEPYIQVIEEIIKTNGEVIPKREYMTKDRALYKSTTMNRYYRKPYPIANTTGLKLYKCNKLSTILRHRDSLYDYCGEYFDVYDENGKVDLSKQ